MFWQGRTGGKEEKPHERKNADVGLDTRFNIHLKTYVRERQPAAKVNGSAPKRDAGGKNTRWRHRSPKGPSVDDLDGRTRSGARRDKLKKGFFQRASRRKEVRREKKTAPKGDHRDDGAQQREVEKPELNKGPRIMRQGDK